MAEATWDLSSALKALEVVYDARTSNENRKSATIELDRLKDTGDALSAGVTLAQDTHRPINVRYFGFSILEHKIKYSWEGFNDEQTAQIKDWLVELAHSVDGSEPQFVRKKIAQLLEEIAERSWGITWHTLDQDLVNLWEKNLHHRQVVFSVLETLSDKVFGKEDAATGLRGAELGKLCVDLFSSSVHRNQSGVNGDHSPQVSWIDRLLQFLAQVLQGNDGSLVLRECFSMAMSVLRSIMSWISLKTLATSDCLSVVLSCLGVDDPDCTQSSTEVLNALYHRSSYSRDEIEKLVAPLIATDGLSLLTMVYRRLSQRLDDSDDASYIALKRLSEMVCSLGAFFEHALWMLDSPGTCNFAGFVRLSLDISHCPSLTVSIPMIYLWTKLLTLRRVRHSHEFQQSMSEILELCRTRMIRYEYLPQDHQDPVLRYLDEDLDTMPERHAFCGNYRRFCSSIIEQVIRRSPFEATYYILSQSEQLLQRFSSRAEACTSDVFSTDSREQLEAEAQCATVQIAIKSYVHWSKGRKTGDEQIEHDHCALLERLNSWCTGLLRAEGYDPIIEKRILTLVADLATTALSQDASAGVHICEQVLGSPLQTNLGYSPLDEATRDLQSVQMKELRKLSTHFADTLFGVHDNVSSAVQQRLNQNGIDQRTRLEHEAFMFNIVQSSSRCPQHEKRSGLETIAESLKQQWQDTSLEQHLNGFDSILRSLGLDEFPQYFLDRQAASVRDWASAPLDERGLRIRDELPSRLENLPLQATRTVLSMFSSIRNTSSSSEMPHEPSRRLAPIVLPRLLPLLSFAHAFKNPATWIGYPTEMSPMLQRIVQDRVWQNGISGETRDDFFRRVRDSKATLEGLASAIRFSIRTVRELCMWILDSLSMVSQGFYAMPKLASALADALYKDAYWLSSHQLSALLNLSSALFDRCPPENRKHFLPPLLTSLFKQIDAKTSAEWTAIARLRDGEDQSLGLEGEMKNESVLRNLTHSAVLLTSNLLGYPAKGNKNPSEEHPTVRAVILTTPTVLEPLVLYATHTIQAHDSRSCAVITRVLRSLLPEFQHKETSGSQTTSATIDANVAASAREFFSTEVLKACINSMHDPYFAEMQKDLAALVASIIYLYSSRTETPKHIVLSLPGMTEAKVDSYFEQIRSVASERQQRALVLSLLEGVRGTSIHEQGKITQRPRRSAMEEQFMTPMAVDEDSAMGASNNGIARAGSPELAGVAELLG